MHPNRLFLFVLGVGSCLPTLPGLAPANASAADDLPASRVKMRLRVQQPSSRAMCVAFAPGGKTFATGTFDADAPAILWDAVTGKKIRQFDAWLCGYGVRSLAFSPNGKILATGGRTDHVGLWDLETGRKLQEISNQGGPVIGLVFSPDGQTLIYGGATDGKVHLWDVVAKKEIRVFQAEHSQQLSSLALAPNGRILVSGGENLTLWVLPLGKMIRRTPQESPFTIDSVAFSPDGAMIAVGNWNAVLELSEAATGAQLFQTKARFGDARVMIDSMAVAFSPDGRLVASASRDAAVRVWEVQTGQERLCLKGHDGEATSVCFAPSGDVLSGSMDGSAILWDVSLAGAKPIEAGTDAKTLEAYWDRLAGDAAQAFQAMCQLARSPGATVSFFNDQLFAPKSASAETVKKWIAQLDDDEFDERERASAALEKLGVSVGDQLLQAVANESSAELRFRAKQLLAKLSPAALRAAEVRESRVVEVLEHLGTPEALALLEALAKRSPESRLAREAKASRDRIRKPKN